MRRTIALLLATLVSCGAHLGSDPEPPTALSHIASLSSFAAHVHPLDRLERVEGGFRRVTGAWRPVFGIEAVLPARAGAPLRIASTHKPAAWVELVAVNDHEVPGNVAGNALVHADAARDTDVVLLAEAARIEEIRLLRTADAPRTTTYRLTLGPDAASARVNDDVVEIVDREGAVVVKTEPLFALDAHGEHVPVTASIAGQMLSIQVAETAKAVHPIALDPAWVSAGSLSVARYGHGYGRVSGDLYVIGGRTGPASLPNGVQSWKPPNAWSNEDALIVPREQHTVTECGVTLQVIGGIDGTGSALSSTQYYSAFTGGAGPAMLGPRTRHSAVCLGLKIVVAGGSSGGSALLSTAEIGSSTDTPPVVATASMPAARASMAAVALSSSRALFTGGEGPGGPQTSAYIYDITSGTWSSAGSMATPRMNHGIVLLASGKVLVAGGRSSSVTESTATVELYDPATNTWTTRRSMSSRRTSFALIEVAAGRVLAAGGSNDASTEVYDVANDTWLPAGSLSSARNEAGGGFVGALGSRTVVVAGGKAAAGATVFSTADQFQLLSLASPCTVSGECASGCCTAGACVACPDAGADTSAPPDTSVTDTAVSVTDTAVSVTDTAVSITDTAVADSGSTSDTTTSDTATVDSSEPDVSVPDTSVTDSAVVTDTNSPGDLCAANDECAAESFCDQGRCVPRIERPELGCGCTLVGAPESKTTPVLASLAGLLMIAARRRRTEAHARRGR